ncbi:MAG: type 4a pilus biogenesis protein PilO [bacterium]|nr:type 4a pilus biogenesis protein PilO [bacterium]MDZ4231688.1 type 4a pilus biogenesis protein PilO [Candidatus Pacearchaeota archaeon]
MSNRLIPIAVLLSLAFTIGFLGARPQYEEWSVLVGQERVKRAEVANQAAYVENLRELDGEINQRADQFLKLSATIPSSSQIPRLYELVGQMAAESGLVFRDLSSSVTSESSDEGGAEIKEISLNMSVEGTYDALKELFSASRRSERFFTVGSVSFQAPNEEELFTASVELATYSY